MKFIFLEFSKRDTAQLCSSNTITYLIYYLVSTVVWDFLNVSASCCEGAL